MSDSPQATSSRETIIIITRQAAEGANADMMTVKEATIAALTAELKEKDKFLQLSKNKVQHALCNVGCVYSVVLVSVMGD